jgi:uncharacterized protein
MNLKVEAALKQFRSSMPWLPERTLFLTRHGSHAYGLNTETSDEDFKGFAVAPREYYMGFVKTYEQAECRDPCDMVVYEIKKFFRLAADCNPSIIEVLWTDPSDHIVCTNTASHIRENAAAFLSTKARHTFSGYALSQLKRIQRHYEWLNNPPQKEPVREDYSLPERTTLPGDQRALIASTVKKRVDEWYGLLDFDEANPATALAVRARVDEYLENIHVGQDQVWRAAARDCAVPENVIEVIMAERAYNSARETWRQYQHWKATRNPARAELEAKFGYDTKHAMHLVRLMRMGEEILRTGKVLVKRPDREELLAIRRGAWKYEDLIKYAKTMDETMAEAEKVSPLPKRPNREKLDEICMRVVEIYVR